MRHRARRTGLGLRVAAAIAAVSTLATGVTVFALYRGTGNRLRDQIDTQLRLQGDEWRQALAAGRVTDPAALIQTARRYIADQRYHPETLVVVVQSRTGTIVTSDAELLRGEGSALGRGLGTAPAGLGTIATADAGDLRTLTLPVGAGAGAARLGTFRIAASLAPVSQAQASLLRTYALAGGLALLAAAIVGTLVGHVLAAPLRRMATIARAVDGGDLSVRIGPQRGGAEAIELAEAFDRMLDRLQAAFQRQRDFVSDASHELRTPLTVLRAQIELLDHDRDARTREETRRLTLRRLDELDRLVEDLLTLARAEGGRVIEPETIELTGFFDDLRRDLPLFGDRRYVVAAVAGTLWADPERLTQILRNLVRNAVTHTSAGGRVEVRARALGDRLEIVVQDDGPGIAPEELERIFERFHRLGSGRSREKGGTGLGLAIVRALVQAHGGTVTAEGVRPHGAAFRVVLPGYTPAGVPGAAEGVGAR